MIPFSSDTFQTSIVRFRALSTTRLDLSNPFVVSPSTSDGWIFLKNSELLFTDLFGEKYDVTRSTPFCIVILHMTPFFKLSYKIPYFPHYLTETFPLPSSSTSHKRTRCCSLQSTANTASRMPTSSFSSAVNHSRISSKFS